jgi:hypothetical protein
MATHLHPDPQVKTLRVCDSPDLVLEDFKGNYLTLREPEPGEEWRVLETWHCPFCRSGNWAEVVFNGKHIRSIENAELTAEIVSRAHFISDWVDELFERVVGESMYVSGAVRKDFAQKLIQHLK